jgi:alanyl-tRNA synthetase
MGDTGPCGPCSEILYDRGDGFGPAHPDNGERYFEIWNLVFMQFQVDVPGGPRRPLPAPSIDTGAGLERIASILQGVGSNFETDLFVPLLELASEIAGVRYGRDEENDVSLRVIADHARMTAFCMAEGILPGKNERPYVLRRVMRRAIRHGHRLGIDRPFLHRVTDGVIDLMGTVYPELVERREMIANATEAEEVLFRRTLASGLTKLSANEAWIERDGRRLIPGDVAYDLYQQDGFPRDLIEVLGHERGFGIDEVGWAAAEQRHKERSKGDAEGFADAIDPVFFSIREEVQPTEFVGYERETARSEIAAMVHLELERAGDGEENAPVRGRARTSRAAVGDEVEIVTFVTPCYAEAGGQVGDTGTIRSTDGVADILDTQKQVGLYVHRCRVRRGFLAVGDSVTVEVDRERRAAIRRNHSATHLLHWALRSILGPQATQRGSIVEPSFLRFDFNHGEPLSDDQVRRIEDLANEKILDNVPVETEVTTLAAARERGAMSLFGEKYGEQVRLVRISTESLELCGGTHASRSGDIGMVKLTRQESIGAGTRRIYAVTGLGGLGYVRGLERCLDQVGSVLREGDRELVPERVARLERERRQLSKEVESLRRQLATGSGDDPLSGATDVAGFKVVARRLPVGDAKAMMEAADAVRDRIGSGVALLGAESAGKASLVLVVTKDLTARLDAVELIRRIAPIVGAKGGGGRPDLARTGGPDVAAIDSALAALHDTVARALAEKQGG